MLRRLCSASTPLDTLGIWRGCLSLGLKIIGLVLSASTSVRGDSGRVCSLEPEAAPSPCIPVQLWSETQPPLLRGQAGHVAELLSPVFRRLEASAKRLSCDLQYLRPSCQVLVVLAEASVLFRWQGSPFSSRHFSLLLSFTQPPEALFHSFSFLRPSSLSAELEVAAEAAAAAHDGHKVPCVPVSPSTS